MARIVKNKTDGDSEPINKKRRGPTLQNTNPMHKLFIANHHTAPVIIPRSVKGAEGAVYRITLTPLVFPPGIATPVDSEVWRKVRLHNRMIDRYLERGLLAEIRRPGGVIATMSETSDLIPPDHLRTSAELEGSPRVEREVVGEVSI